MDFTAIDFETASRRQDSACQLAAVRVRDGQIVHQAMWMIRPEPCYFHPMNIQIHGITPDRVADEPVFADLWDDIRTTIGDDCVIAHNASFDIGVLQACLKSQRIAVPTIPYSCTRAIARKTWPGRRGYGLKPLSDWLGVRFQHHDALEDSVACAKVLLAAAATKSAVSLSDLETKLRISRGALTVDGYKGPTAARASRRKSATGSRRDNSRDSSSGQQISRQPAPTITKPAVADPGLDLQRLMVRAELIQPLSGSRIVFTGRFTRMSRENAEGLATRLGGSLQSSVTKRTDLLVVGSPDERTIAAGRAKSVKEEAALQINAAAETTIRIVTESEFLGLIVDQT